MWCYFSRWCGDDKCCWCWLRCFLLWWLLLTALFNMLCYTSATSPFFTISPNIEPWIVFVVYLLGTGAAVYAINRGRMEDLKQTVTTRYVLKKSVGVLFVYLLLTPLLFYIARVAMYPLMFLDYETPDDDRAEYYHNAVTHNFKGADGEALLGYSIEYLSHGCESFDDATTKIPVVFNGGNGGWMYANVYGVEDFIWHKLTERDCATSFVAYSFSYRGYYPNDALWGNEANMISDAGLFYEYVRSLYEGTTKLPILVSHSLGTGPTSAMAGTLEADEVACVVLGMPFSTMSQTVLEVAFYSPWIFLYLADSWNSVGKIKHMDKQIPLAVLSGGQDELIPPHHQATMFDEASSEDKIMLFREDAYHMMIYETITWKENKAAYIEWFERACWARKGDNI